MSHVLRGWQLHIYKANLNSVGHVLEMLNTFEKAFGQKINVEKSSICFSRNTTISLKQEIYRRFSLGLPNIIGRNKTVTFDFLKEKMVD